MKQFYSFCTVKTGTKLQKRQLLFVSFSVSGPSDNSVHGKTGLSRESSFMTAGNPNFSASYILYDEPAPVNMNELTLPFYKVSKINKKQGDSSHIYNNGIGAGASSEELTHFLEKT